MTDKAQPQLQDQSQPQQERLFYLEFRLYFLGHANRSDLQKRFGLKESSASRDIALYKKLVPDNVVYDYGIKSYIPQDSFKPLFSYTATQVLTALSHGFGDDYSGPKFPEIVTEAPCQTPLPYIPTLAAITRAIHKQQSVTVTYVSEIEGERTVTLVPHALINTGTRWAVRAYDRTNSVFSNFVINRIKAVQGVSTLPIHTELKEADSGWNQIVELSLVPHPALPYKEAIEQEFGMHNGILKMTSRVALKDYLLSQWDVDLSATPSEQAGDYLLWLRQ
ncbi:WYL domain-containing protein [Reinekea marinisedimentorum]|uniref:WYL domain-containing protein n=1 Tax=Reinekea marinisedimentorum TaxID=230495 RepID=A0A4R3I2V4_9GAMM|nr:WYL domain-containing protein [Reinekea marinisedimentorum]TCS39998.1 WYL domain-containing protein [Reinekea marinisedimentorum]